MKKWVIGFIGGITMLLVFIYVFISDVINLKTNIAVKATGQGIHRMLLDKSNMAKWWPEKINNDSFYFNDFVYKIDEGNITVMPFSIKGKNTNLTTSLFLISINTDSTLLQWVGSMTTSYNPVKRIGAWMKAKEINKDMDVILQKMANFYSKPENIYGLEIKKVLILDSLLITTSGRCKGYPKNEFVYTLIDKLRKYVTKQGGKESSYPMLNIATTDSINYDVKVALPVDKMVPATEDIFQKRMPALKPILVTEVKGGPEAIHTGFEQLQKYSDDRELKTAAIPFYSLITDRTKEPDPNKWITKIYYPVMLYN